MAKLGTGLSANLSILYRVYGGLASVVRSGYFLVSVVLTAISWKLTLTMEWIDLSQSILPTLSGFSIAAYALFFAVLDKEDQKKLFSPLPELGNRAPLMILAASITHAVIVQLFSILYSVVFMSFPLLAAPLIVSGRAEAWERPFEFIGLFLSSVGSLAFFYSVCLIAACVLSIFRLLEIKSRL